MIVLDTSFIVSYFNAIDEKDNVHVAWSETWTLEGNPPPYYTPGAYYTSISKEGKVLQAPVVVSEAGSYMDITVSESQVYVLTERGMTGVTVTSVPEFPFAIIIASVAIGVLIAVMRFTRLKIK